MAQAVQIGVMVVAALVTAQAARNEGIAKANAQNYNAQVAARNAKISIAQSDRDAEQQDRSARMQMGRMRADFGASGIALEGSPLDVLEMSASMAELDYQNIKYKGQMKALGYDDAVTLDHYSASNAIRQGNESATGILLSSVGKSIGSYGSAGSTAGGSA